LAKEIVDFVYEIFFIFAELFYMLQNLTTWGFTPPPLEGVLQICKTISLAGFEPANLESNGKHTDHCTTEATGSGV
jgi:hypothetical protein